MRRTEAATPWAAAVHPRISGPQRRQTAGTRHLRQDEPTGQTRAEYSSAGAPRPTAPRRRRMTERCLQAPPPCPRRGDFPRSQTPESPQPHSRCHFSDTSSSKGRWRQPARRHRSPRRPGEEGRARPWSLTNRTPRQSRDKRPPRCRGCCDYLASCNPPSLEKRDSRDRQSATWHIEQPNVTYQPRRVCAPSAASVCSAPDSLDHGWLLKGTRRPFGKTEGIIRPSTPVSIRDGPRAHLFQPRREPQLGRRVGTTWRIPAN